MIPQENIFNSELAEAIEKALKNSVQPSHIIGILAAAQFKVLIRIHEG